MLNALILNLILAETQLRVIFTDNNKHLRALHLVRDTLAHINRDTIAAYFAALCHNI